MEHQTEFHLWDKTLQVDHVIDAFFRLAETPSETFVWRSVRDVAGELGVSKSPALYRLLQSMFAEGALDFITVRGTNGVNAYLYRLNIDYISYLK